MRYIKTYENHSDDNYEDVRDEIVDISHDIVDEDDRFVIAFGGEWRRYKSLPKYVSISKEPYALEEWKMQTNVDFYKTRIPFSVSEIKNFLYRLLDYLGDNFISIKYIYGFLSTDIYSVNSLGNIDENKKMIDKYIAEGNLIHGTGNLLHIKVEFK